MEPTPQIDRLVKGIRGLTIAVWCLVALYGIQVLAWMVSTFAPAFYMRHMTSATADSSPRVFEDWSGLSFEEKVKRASIVLITEYKSEGGKLRAMIKEELKHRPGATYHYKIGDEYLPMSIVPKENTVYGEGDLVLLVGSPATRQESYSIYNGSIGGLNEMPLTKVREIIARVR